MAQEVNGFDPKKTIVTDETGQAMLSKWLDLDGKGATGAARGSSSCGYTSHAHSAAIEHAIGNAEHVVGVEFLLHRFDDLDVGL
jgi:hypothetical protein